MITCLGLVVGAVKSPVRQFVLNECAKFLKEHSYLIGKDVEFKIDNKVYATVIDTHNADDKFGVLFMMYNGETTIGIA